MSLTTQDLREIRTTVREEVNSIIGARVEPRFDSLDGRIEALENDIKDIYKMITELRKLTRPISHIEKFDLEHKVIKSYENIIAIAKEAGITLPRV